MNDRADVVVIGGGVIGSSAAFHLQQAGAGKVRLLERDDLSQGTSAAGAGFVALWGELLPGDRESELAVERYGLTLYGELAAEGHQIDYAHNGMLMVAPDEQSWSQLRTIEEVETTASELVGPDRVEELTSGAIPASGVLGAIWHSAGIQFSAGKAGPVLVDRFRQEGGIADTRRPVSAIQISGGKVVGVETPAGEVACDAVVLAAGAWSRELLRPHGVFLPTVPLVTSRLVTEPLGIPTEMPTLFLLGLAKSAFSALWVRGADGSLLFGGHYGSHPREAFVDAELPARFDQLPLDGVFECRRLGEEAAKMMPAFSRYKSLTVAHGAPCFTADARTILGPVPGIEGLFVVAGDNEAGVSHAPGQGRAIAELVVHGSSDLADVSPWAFDRFGEYTSEDEVAAAVRARFTARFASSERVEQ